MLLYPIPKLDICIPLREKIEPVLYFFVDFYFCQFISITHLPISYFFNFTHAQVLLILKLCIYAKSISLHHKNYNFLDCDWFEKLTFSFNLLAKFGKFVMERFDKLIISKL